MSIFSGLPNGELSNCQQCDFQLSRPKTASFNTILSSIIIIIMSIQAVQAKCAWVDARKSSSSLAMASFIYACLETVLESGGSCISALAMRNLPAGVTLLHDDLFGDSHAEMAMFAYQQLNSEARLSVDVVHSLIDEATQLEDECCKEMGTGIPWLNLALVSQYIRFVADQLLLRLGYTSKYGLVNPFPWMVEHDKQRERRMHGHFGRALANLSLDAFLK